MGLTIGAASVSATDFECNKARDVKSFKVMDKQSSADGPSELKTCFTLSVALACRTANALRNQIDPPKDQGNPTWVSSNFKSNNKPGECRANREGSEMDAATHAYLSCELYRQVADDNARKILDAHEFEHPEDTCESHEQDFNNNEIGRQLSKQQGSCTNLAFGALNTGRLQVNNPFPAGMCSWKGNGL